MTAEISYWQRPVSLTHDLSSAFDCNFPSAHDQSEALPRSGYWHLNSMKFLQSFLRRHFTGTPVVVSRNNSCFLRLSDGCSVQLMQGCDAAGCSHVGWHRPQCRPKQLLLSYGPISMQTSCHGQKGHFLTKCGELFT